MHINEAGKPAETERYVAPSNRDIANSGDDGGGGGDNRKGFRRDGPPGDKRAWQWYPDRTGYDHN